MTLPTTEPTAAIDAQPGRRELPTKKRGNGGIVKFFESYALLILLLAMVVFFSVWPQTSEVFPTAANLRILVASQAVLGVVALGALIPLICGEFDLSVGAVAALSAVLVAETLSAGSPVLVGIAVAVGAGAVVGLANGLIVTRMHVNAVVCTLGMSTIVVGYIRQDTGGLAPPSQIPASLTDFGTGTIVGIPTIFIMLLVIAGATYFILDHTPIGRRIYALGSNPAAAELVGLRTRRLRFVVLFVGAVLCGIAGLLYVARAGGADPKLSGTFTLPALAAAFLSAASVRPGRYNVWGAIIAIYFLAVLNNGLNLAGAQPYISDYLSGGALILGVALAAILRRRNQRA
ncbi:ABC transporter permease [Rhodococcus jostii]|uniref:Autoinducer 2 import system permease protein LsrD n=1 Tax=Rhodococcus jostii TaxID=132919 RepID=A0ABU4CSG3_RHOJO|nr:ABC transporter permease [Rhodococcus jostii]MDV6286494.1 ABC transporter permease [Rhodococcus jostii]